MEGGAEEVNIDLKSEPKTKNKQKNGRKKMEKGKNGLKRLVLHSRKVQKHKYKEPPSFHLPLKKWKQKSLGKINPQISIEKKGSKGAKSVARGRKRGKRKPRSTQTKRGNSYQNGTISREEKQQNLSQSSQTFYSPIVYTSFYHHKHPVPLPTSLWTHHFGLSPSLYYNTNYHTIL